MSDIDMSDIDMSYSQQNNKIVRSVSIYSSSGALVF